VCVCVCVMILNTGTVNKLVTCSSKTWMYRKQKGWATKNNIKLLTMS
jgi:hypothetical protein